jgi:hypothetical protein
MDFICKICYEENNNNNDIKNLYECKKCNNLICDECIKKINNKKMCLWCHNTVDLILAEKKNHVYENNLTKEQEENLINIYAKDVEESNKIKTKGEEVYQKQYKLGNILPVIEDPLNAQFFALQDLPQEFIIDELANTIAINASDTAFEFIERNYVECMNTDKFYDVNVTLSRYLEQLFVEKRELINKSKNLAFLDVKSILERNLPGPEGQEPIKFAIENAADIITDIAIEYEKRLHQYKKTNSSYVLTHKITLLSSKRAALITKKIAIERHHNGRLYMRGRYREFDGEYYKYV